MAQGRDRKILRVGIIQNGRLVEERLLRRRDRVTLGQSPRNTFVLPSAGLPRSLMLFDVRDGRYRLHFRSGLNGKLSVDGAVLDFRALREQKLARKVGDGYVVTVPENGRGKVVIDDVTVLFQFVVPPPAPTAARLPSSMRAGWSRFVDWPFVTALIGSMVVQVFSITFIVSQDYPEPPTGIDALDDRFVSMLIAEPDEPEVPEEKEEPVDEKQKEKKKEPEPEKAPEPEKKPEKKPEPKTAEEIAKRNAEDMRRMQKAVKEKTILGVIGTVGGEGPGQFVNTLQDGAARVAMDEAFDGTRGIAIGGTADAEGRQVGAEAGSVAGIDDGALQARPRKAVETEKKSAEVDVRGSVAVKSPTESFGTGDLDLKAVTQVVRRRTSAVKGCYEKQLKRTPDLAGKVKIQFTILESGRVSEVEVRENTTGNDDVGQCIIARVKRWRFPKPQGGSVTVSFPFVFAPSG